MMYLFQIEVAPGNWLNIGSARGHGAHGVGTAIYELMKANGGTLEPGEYRCRPLDGITHEWSHLTLKSSRGELTASRRGSSDNPDADPRQPSP